MAYRCLATFLLFVFTCCTGVKSQSRRLNFVGAIFHTDTQTYEYRVNITQNILVNQTILTARCTDMEDPMAVITYSRPIANSTFSINPQSGEVKLAVDSLTLENDKKYNAQIRCSSIPNSDLTASLRVHYQLKNEFSPVFSISSQPQFSFTENNDISGENAIIFDFNATDSDRGDCGVIRYSITSRNTNLFQIEPTTGVLSFLRPLDREMRDQHTIAIQARNPLCPTDRTAESSVVVRVDDINDTPPQFSQVVYNGNITENTQEKTFLLQVLCHDPDTNSQILYSKEHRPEQFYMDTEGNVFAEQPIDYEATPSFSFSVFCRDENGVTDQVSSASVNITISPENEHRPSFMPSSLTVVVNDIAPAGTVIVAPVEHGSNALKTFNVTDKDRGLNHGEYTFTVNFPDGSNFSENFNLDYKTGVLLLQQKFVKLECGQENGGGIYANINIMITACDIHDLSGCDILNLHLFVLTSNCSVFFPHNSSNISVSELTQPGTSLVSLPCEDYSNYTNKTVTISPNDKDSSTHFSYNTETRSLFLIKALDYEVKHEFSFQLFCKNDFNTTAFVSVVVNVLPENEFPPVFEKSVHILKIDDLDKALPLRIGQLNATDRDRGLGGDLTYSIVETSHYFTVNPDGQVLLIQSLPESENIFSIVVSASDGEFSDNATLIIIDESLNQTDDEEVTLLIIVFSATLIFVVVLLSLSWLLICCLLCRRGRKKRVGNTFSEPNNRQNMDFRHYSTGGQPMDCLGINSAAFDNDPAFKSSTIQSSTTKNQEPEYETILCKAQNYSEPLKARQQHASVVSQNSTDCYVSMQNPAEVLGRNEYTVLEQVEQEPVVSNDGRNNSISTSCATHPPLRANTSAGDLESSLEFGGAVETSLEFSAMRGISLDYRGPSRVSEGGTSPRTPSRRNFEMIAEVGESQCD